MKGSIEDPTYLLSAVLFIIVIFVPIASIASTHNQVTAEVTQSLKKLALSDGIKVFESCIKDGVVITPEFIENKAQLCMGQLNIDYIQITDIETSKEWVYGEKDRGQYSYRTFSEIKSGDNITGAIIYAES